MLVTTCKFCGARFRVTPDQLNLRQGQVRCGQCREVFNGFESLERFPGDDTGARLLAMRAGFAQQADPVAQLADIDVGKRLRPAAGGTPEPRPAAPPASAVPPARPASPPAVPPPPEPADLPEVPDLLLESDPGPNSNIDIPLHGPEETPAPGRAEPASPRPESAPSVVLAANLPAAPAPSRAWAFGVVLLALVLALQVGYAFRSRLAQQYPGLRPVLESTCAAAGCRVPWVNDESALKLDDSELLEVPGKPGQIALQARVRNLSPSPQEFPHIELTLTDISGQTAVRRVLRPMDYLGRAPAQGEVMAPGAEVLLSVRLETPRLRPTGYELMLFYP
jgi:predicted Zn finger-like uncharacterized protein